ncbi:MAG: aminodeoxychorismate synthase component I [Acidobacteriota bacterium]|nr:MAG: aminodeoxychorismate synthase component I [Acidobacteriota bacterium]
METRRHAKLTGVTHELKDPDLVVSSILNRSADEPVCILDSCSSRHGDSRLLLAGIEPVRITEVPAHADANACLHAIEAAVSGGKAVFFTISYDLGPKLLGIQSRHASLEPLVFMAEFRRLLKFDHETKRGVVIGSNTTSPSVNYNEDPTNCANNPTEPEISVRSDFSRAEYLAAVEEIRERIRDGVTYQTNLTQKLIAELPDALTPEEVFQRLRKHHPAPFSAFMRRKDSTVISASPERFFKVSSDKNGKRTIRTSPIKGTRPRGTTPHEDERLKSELLSSEKDRAENTMIVDLLRNDIGRICEFGSVRVERLCEIEEHPTYFNLVSTIAGDLRDGVSISDILRAVFPCGSITGAPKISTMRIIDRIERGPRGLSMGAIGYYIPESFGVGERLDLSVAIRTMTVHGRHAEFNVGGGITIDSDPAAEYDETLVKATALLDAINGKLT